MAPAPATSNVALGFNNAQLAALVNLGVTDVQVSRLARRLPTIREYVLGEPTKADVRAPLVLLLKRLMAAEEIVAKMTARGASPALREARGHLAIGAHAFDPQVLCNDLELATEGTIPSCIDVPTLLRILVAAAAQAVKHAPSKRRAPTAPWRAVVQIVAALKSPRDAASVAAATRLRPRRADDSDFVALCSIVFCAADGTTEDKHKPRGDIDRAVRLYRHEQEASRTKHLA